MAENNITIENARLIFKNFSGEEGQFNAKGNRNFCVVLDERDGSILAEQGWNVRTRPPREEGDDPLLYLQVGVKFDPIPPKVVLITSRGKRQLDESTIDILDYAEIANVDLIIRPYNWNVSGREGVKAYLKSIYVTLQEDELEQKYSNVPDSESENA